jgi:hypothetical protein
MKRLLLLLFIQAPGDHVLAVDKTGMETTGPASFLDADYTITTTGGELIVTDLAGTGEVLELSENSGNIRILVTGKTYSIDGGAITAFTTPADIPISGKTGITIHAGAGDDTLNIGAFATQLPSLTINGDAGNDVVNFNGSMTFNPNANLDLDMLNDALAPGIDGMQLAAGAQLLLSGTGMAVVKMGRSISLAAGSMLQSQNGNISFEANYQLVPNTESYIGVHIGGGTVEITGTGLLAIKGKGGVPNLRGVVINSGGQVIGGNTGIVHIEGKGTELATASADGILLEGTDSKITSHGADIAIVGYVGTSGARNNPTGFYNFNGHVFAPGSANINISGYGDLALGNSTGVSLFGGVIETAGGNITVNGTGALVGTYLNARSVLKTIEGGNIYLSGNLVSNSVATPYSGLAQDMFSSVTTVDGHITISGTGSETAHDIIFYGASAPAFYSNITSENGNIVVIADSFTGGTTNLTTTNGYIGYLPRSVNRHISLGGPDLPGAGGILGLSDAELDFASAPAIKIGDANTALVGLAAPISRALATNMEITGYGLLLAASPLDLNGGELLINTVNGTTPGAAGVDFSGSTVSFETGNKLSIAINGPDADTGYQQFNVEGAVDLTGVNLVFTRSYMPTKGQVFTIVVNDGTDAILGTFQGLAEGARIPNFCGSPLDGIVSYAGGDGNDVVILVSDPLPVTLVSFTGKKTTENQNTLQWITADEKDFDRFEIQRSEDAKAFETIGSVDGEAAINAALKSYEFADNQAKDMGYYRLKMVDTDGSFNYSKIISINSTGQSAEDHGIVGPFYPNPSLGRVYVDLYTTENGSWTITVSDATGRVIRSENRTLQKGMHKITLDHLPSGLNLVRFDNGRYNIVRKLMRK